LNGADGVNERIRNEILYLSSEVRRLQDTDGAWRLLTDNGVMTDAYFIILCRMLGLSAHEELISRLCSHLLDSETGQGTWSAYPDEPGGNFSATTEAVYALICSGAISPEDERVNLAKSTLGNYTQPNGAGWARGTEKLGKSTRAFFAGIGQLPWPNYHFPDWILIAPKWSPLHFNRFVGYARAHIAPVLMASILKADLSNLALVPAMTKATTAGMKPGEPRNSDKLSIPRNPSMLHELGQFLTRQGQFTNNPKRKEAVLNRLEAYILANLEQDGTLYSYASSTFFMILALIGRGYAPDHPLIKKAFAGIAGLAHHTQSFSHIQNADATVWNTGLMIYALQTAASTDAFSPETTSAEAATSEPSTVENKDTISRAVQYLYKRQHQTGGWGFSDRNTLVPDVDDTCAALRALAMYQNTLQNSNRPEAKAFANGIRWVWSMQNKDGGWPAFEKNVDHLLFTNIRVDGAKGVLTDPSSADLTGRTLEFFGNYCNMTILHPNIKKAVHWLLKKQNSDGSWQGRWGVCFVYGTWAAITGLRAVGLSYNHPALQKAAAWLLSIQHADGGFGESCQSDVRNSYVPLQYCTISQTAWGLDALIALFDEPTIPIHRAADFLLEHVRKGKEKWGTYPTGAGLPGSFYIGYQSYNYIWPLLALGHYTQKYRA
jgi:sporulenol synthase